MIITEVFPVLMWASPPVSHEEATRRVSEASGGVLDAPMTKLVGSVFMSFEQLEKALFACNYKTSKSFLMKSGPLQTMKISCEQINDETVYHIIATEYPSFLLIHNVKLVSAPHEDPKDIETFNQTLKEDGLL